MSSFLRSDLIALLSFLGAVHGASVLAAPSRAADSLHILDRIDLRGSDMLPSQPRFERNAECETRFPPQRLIQHRNQGNTLFCYAYTSVDLIMQRTGIDASALDLATGFYFTDPAGLHGLADPAIRQFLTENPSWDDEVRETRGPDGVDIGKDLRGRHLPYFFRLEGGEEDTTLLMANVNGLCEDDRLPSNGGFANPVIREIFRDLEAKVRRDHGRTPSRCATLLSGVIPRFRDPTTDAFNALWMCEAERRCQRKASPVPLVPVRFYVADSYADFRKGVESGSIDTEQARSRLFGALDYALDHGRVVAIGYDFYSIASPSSQQLPDPQAEGDHASSIIGRRAVGGRCQYLLRDPSGVACDDYLPRYRSRCIAQGHLWLYDDELAETFYSVSYLR